MLCESVRTFLDTCDADPMQTTHGGGVIVGNAVRT